MQKSSERKTRETAAVFLRSLIFFVTLCYFLRFFVKWFPIVLFFVWEESLAGLRLAILGSIDPGSHLMRRTRGGCSVLAPKHSKHRETTTWRLHLTSLL